MSARPLLVRMGALGDMVLMTVALRLLHARFGQPVDILGSGPWTHPLLRAQPGVGEIYLLRSRSHPFLLSPNQWRLLRALRQRGAGPTWLFDAHNDKTRWLLQRAGWVDEQFASLSQLPDIAQEHFCDHWQRFALLDPPALGGARHAPPDHEAYPELHVEARSVAELSSWLEALGIGNRPFVLIQVGNKRTMRRGAPRRRSNTKFWPEGHWAEVLRGLRTLHPQHALLLLGVPQEAALNDQILSIARLSDTHNLAREMTVLRLMALARRAFGMVSVDTGPAHVAAAVGGRVLTLFDSREKMNMYLPRGPGALVRGLVAPGAGAPSLLGISPTQVLDAWRSLLRPQADPVAAVAAD